LNLESLGKAEVRVGMVRVLGRSGPRLPSRLLLSRRGDCLESGFVVSLLNDSIDFEEKEIVSGSLPANSISK